MISLVAPGGRKSCVICSEMTVLWLVLICMFVGVLWRHRCDLSDWLVWVVCWSFNVWVSRWCWCRFLHLWLVLSSYVSKIIMKGESSCDKYIFWHWLIGHILTGRSDLCNNKYNMVGEKVELRFEPLVNQPSLGRLKLKLDLAKYNTVRKLKEKVARKINYFPECIALLCGSRRFLI